MDIEFDESKFIELILFIAQECEDHRYFGATKLNKILFFSDFTAYAQLGRPITGADYMAIEDGPVPRRLVPVREQMRIDGEIILENHGNQDRIKALRKPKLELFTAAEMLIVYEIINDLESKDAATVSGLSHKELSWKAGWVELLATGHSPTIPYEAVHVSNEPPSPLELEDVMALGKEDGWSFR